LQAIAALPPNQWMELARDPSGARRACAIRYVSEARSFFLWGFQNEHPDHPQEHPLLPVSEYDVVYFDPDVGRWQNHLPRTKEKEWSARIPPAPIPRTYAGITTGSERTVLRWATEDAPGVPRPDLNIVHDQVAWHPGLRALVYFTGGLTAAYHVADRRWRDLAPQGSPPPVVGGSLAYDPGNDQVVLFGGGHVVERAADGRPAGYTGMWVYRARDNEWRPWPAAVLPPPRMNTRMVLDARNQVLVLFGGDAQTHYLADTWVLDLKTMNWRAAKAAGPEARAGHFTVYDPKSGLVMVGGGYNRRDLTDLWAYDVRQDRWGKLPGTVPAGFYLTADLDPERNLILLATANRREEDRSRCNTLYPVRTTYGYRLDNPPVVWAAATGGSIPKVRLAPEPSPAQTVRFVNQWVELGGLGTTRTWGSATFDTARGQILYWGGGHCGYEGNDVDMYEVESQSWREPAGTGEFPERIWERGVRLAGVTFSGAPWTDHGRKIYAFDATTRRLILVKPIRLTAGYNPEVVRLFPARHTAAPDALTAPSSYTRYTTWSWDPDSGRWDLLGPAPVGLDTLVTTRHGVLGITVDWPSRLNDAGYQAPYRPGQDTAVYRFDATHREWQRLGEPQASPQNLYEMTALVYDSARDQLLLHGAGPRRDETWTFDLRERRWRHLQPRGASPTASREGVYIPREDVFLLCGARLWAFKPGENVWRTLDISPPGPLTQNRALVYDPGHDLVLLVLGSSGDAGRARVYGLRYRHGAARFGSLLDR
jgi:hypothetical protein